MSPMDLQEKLRLSHSIKRIANYSEEEHFYKGTIEKLQKIKEPAFVLFARLAKEGLNGEELEFEYLSVEYFETGCDLEIPADATHFFLVSEPPVDPAKAKILMQRFSFPTSNFPLRIPAIDPFK